MKAQSRFLGIGRSNTTSVKFRKSNSLESFSLVMDKTEILELKSYSLHHLVQSTTSPCSTGSVVNRLLIKLSQKISSQIPTGSVIELVRPGIVGALVGCEAHTGRGGAALILLVF